MKERDARKKIAELSVEESRLTVEVSAARELVAARETARERVRLSMQVLWADIESNKK